MLQEVTSTDLDCQCEIPPPFRETFLSYNVIQADLPNPNSATTRTDILNPSGGNESKSGRVLFTIEANKAEVKGSGLSNDFRFRSGPDGILAIREMPATVGILLLAGVVLAFRQRQQARFP